MRSPHIFMPQDADAARQDGEGGRKGHRGRRPDRARLARRAARQFLAVSKAPEIVATEPYHRQVIIGRGTRVADDEAFERKLYIIRKVCSGKIYSAFEGKPNDFYVVSMSCRTLIYKGMFLAAQLRAYYADLSDPDFASALALVHQRFSTNTFPSWRLAHPYRFVCHNGEINTVRGNVNWMAARQASVSSDLFGADIQKLWPISYPGQSDTACFDNALEFLMRGGYSLPHAAMMLIPEAWAGNPLMDEDRRAFYEYHAALMEPWDGPAAMAFSDGIHIGATLDRNGLRPARYIVTDDDRVIMASEMGTLPVPPEKIVRKWRLQPGKMLLIDLKKGAIVSDEEIKAELAQGAIPTSSGWPAPRSSSRSLPEVPAAAAPERRFTARSAAGLRLHAGRPEAHPAADGDDRPGSRGLDGHRHADLGAVATSRKLLYTYFKQNFAQVTNPPIDSIREELVMSLVSFIGPRPNILDLEGQGTRKRLEVHQPILTNADLEKIRAIGAMEDNPFRSKTLDITYPAAEGAAGMAAALDQLFSDAEMAVHSGDNIIILSRPHGRAGSRRDPGAAGDRGRPPSPDPQGPAHLGRPRGRDRRSARGASFLRARRLWRRGDQPLSRLRDAARHARSQRHARGSRRARARLPLHQGDR